MKNATNVDSNKQKENTRRLEKNVTDAKEKAILENVVNLQLQRIKLDFKLEPHMLQM